MGCSGSKADGTLELVIRCRERRDLIRAAADHRYALAAAHVSYFRSLEDIGNALRKFVDEDIIVAASASSSSSLSSPSLILPPSSKKKLDEYPLHLHHDDESGSDSESEPSGDPHDCEHRHRNEPDHVSHPTDNKAAVETSFDEQVGQWREQESSFHPLGAFGGYPYGYVDGLPNNQYPRNPHPYPPPYHRSYPDPSYTDPWNLGGGGAPTLQPWYYPTTSNVYYMKKSAPATKTVIQEPLPGDYSDSYGNFPAGYGGKYGYFYEVPSNRMGNAGDTAGAGQNSAPPPPSPKSSAWDFLNPFDGFENSCPSYFSRGGNAYGSNPSSPGSSEVREREGIPDLEEVTETEMFKGLKLDNKSKTGSRKSSGKRHSGRKGFADGPARSRISNTTRRKGEGYSRSVPVNKTEHGARRHGNEIRSRSTLSPSSGDSDGTFLTPQLETESPKPSSPSNHVEITTEHSSPTQYSDEKSLVDEAPNLDLEGSVHFTNDESSDNVLSKSMDEASLKKTGVVFEVEEASNHDGDSSKHSTMTVQPPRGKRDLKGVVAEIRDEFETAATYGKEVAMLLEVGKVPYESNFLKAMLFRLLCLISPSMPSHKPEKRKSMKSATRTMKLAAPPSEDDKARTLSSTLDKLYAWEKKLYKEVKDEERLRIMYLKARNKLKDLDEQGADHSKLDAARISVLRLLSKLDMSIRAIEAIARSIHKLRDEELQPQVAALIFGLINMWRAMLKCHQKQFRAIMDSKMRRLKAIMGHDKDSSSRASVELEKHLRVWCKRFNEWIRTQKSYVETLNGWLLQCLHYIPEETPDGPAPYSPAKLGAPPIFIICNDWQHAMKSISEARVADAMDTFAASLRHLWEKQDEEARQRLKAEYLMKNYETLLGTQDETGTRKIKDARADKPGRLCMVASDTGALVLEDYNKLDIDSMRQRLAEEHTKHKDSLKLVHDAASSSLQGGLVPIFKALESFTAEALQAHENVRLQQQQKVERRS